MQNTIKILTWGLLLSFVCCFTACKSKTVISEITEEESISYDQSTLIDFVLEKELSQILELSMDEDKLAFVEFSTEWCLPCQLMHETLYMNTVIADYYNANFISYMIDATKGEGPDLSFLFQVQEFPTLLILDHKGRVLSQHVGGISGTDLMIFAEEAVEKYQQQTTDTITDY